MWLINQFKSPNKKPPVIKREIEDKPLLTINGSIETDLGLLAKTINNPVDLVIHRFFKVDKFVAAVVYLKSMVNNTDLGTHIID